MFINLSINNFKMNRKNKIYRYSSIVIVFSIFLVISSFFSNVFVLKNRPNDFYIINAEILLFCLFLYYCIYKWIKELHNTVSFIECADDRITLHLISGKTVELLKSDISIEKKFKCSIETNSVLDVYIIESRKKYLIFKKDLTSSQIEALDSMIKGV